LVKGQLQSLSESDLVDCMGTCYGCDGGWPCKAYAWMISDQKGQYATEDDYLYVPDTRKCAFDQSKGVQLIKESVFVKESSEADLKEKVGTVGPASVSIDAGQASFHLYKSGIYDEHL